MDALPLRARRVDQKGGQEVPPNNLSPSEKLVLFGDLRPFRSETCPLPGNTRSEASIRQSDARTATGHRDQQLCGRQRADGRVRGDYSAGTADQWRAGHALHFLLLLV